MTQEVARPQTAASATTGVARRDGRSWLLPLSSGPQEIRALDGLRAVAALSVVVFHAFYSVLASYQHTPLLGYDVTFLWSYGQTGVELFIILSGFLLFAPYARAMLQGTKFPSTRLFYERRILRIVPAYVVCLTILVLFQYHQFLSLARAENIGLHLIFFHDDVPAFNRSIEGPFWTLAWRRSYIWCCRSLPG